MENQKYGGVWIEVRNSDNTTRYKTQDPSAAVGSFIWFDWVPEEEVGHRLFINDVEFPAKNLVCHWDSYGMSVYPVKVHEEILTHILYCVDLYLSFYDV